MRVREKNDQIVGTIHLKSTEELASNHPSFSGKDKATGNGVGKHNGLHSVIASMTWKKLVWNAYLSNLFQLRNHSLHILASCALSNLSCSIGSTWCALMVDCNPFYKVTHMSVKTPPTTHTHKKSYNEKNWGFSLLFLIVYEWTFQHPFVNGSVNGLNLSQKFFKEITSHIPIRGAGKSLLENALKSKSTSR